jgi:opacity protein-like surface antigen
MLAWQSAYAQADLGLKAVGANFGMVSPENIDATVGLGVFLDHGTVAPNVGLESRLDYWSKSESAGSFGSATIRDIVLGVRGRYMFSNVNPKVTPFAGAGLAMHFLNVKTEIPPQDFGGFIMPGMEVSDSTTKLGVDLGGGISAPITPKTAFLAEMWFGVVSDVSQLSLKVGVSYRLGA